MILPESKSWQAIFHSQVSGVCWIIWWRISGYRGEICWDFCFHSWRV